MNSEEIIMLGFVSVIILGVPVVMWLFHRDKKRQEQEEKDKWNRYYKERNKQ